MKKDFVYGMLFLYVILVQFDDPEMKMTTSNGGTTPIVHRNRFSDNESDLWSQLSFEAKLPLRPCPYPSSFRRLNPNSIHCLASNDFPRETQI